MATGICNSFAVVGIVCGWSLSQIRIGGFSGDAYMWQLAIRDISISFDIRSSRGSSCFRKSGNKRSIRKLLHICSNGVPGSSIRSLRMQGTMTIAMAMVMLHRRASELMYHHMQAQPFQKMHGSGATATLDVDTVAERLQRYLRPMPTFFSNQCMLASIRVPR